MSTKRYDIGREYAHSVGAPAITVQPEGGYVRYEDHAALIGEQAAELAEFRRILEGLSQDAIDGGWTAKGISAHAKALEAENERLREALIPALGHIRAASLDYGPDANLDEAEAFLSAALTQQEQGG